MAYTGLYNADGQILTTQVNGSTYTGLYSPDGNWNIVINNSSVYVGTYHPCGALNAVVVSDFAAPARSANGSINVILNTSGGYSPVTNSGSGNFIPPNNQLFVVDTDGAFLIDIDGQFLSDRIS